jgi:hypothetical protein
MIKEKNEKVKREKIYYIYKIHFLCGFPAGRYYLGKHKGYVDDTYGGSGKFCKANDYMYRHYNDVKDVLKIEPYKSNKKTVLQYDKLGNLIKTYDSLVDAAIAICGDKNIGKQISACCLGKKKSVYGFV